LQVCRRYFASKRSIISFICHGNSSYLQKVHIYLVLVANDQISQSFSFGTIVASMNERQLSLLLVQESLRYAHRTVLRPTALSRALSGKPEKSSFFGHFYRAKLGTIVARRSSWLVMGLELYTHSTIARRTVLRPRAGYFVCV
jgi:hypothetical protein